MINPDLSGLVEGVGESSTVGYGLAGVSSFFFFFLLY